ncbi:hypothetical protein MMC28_009895 [Mycoblastus sanguinarius]|nr:hypothetical protein [Mycoblastus sanguinarius]
MQSLTYLLPLLASLAPTYAAPSKLVARNASTCDQYNPVQAGPFAVQNDAWGASAGTGSQCSQIDSFNNGALAWSSTFTWNGAPNNIKSYANAESSNTPCKPLNQYNSIPTTWDWSYSAPITGDVSYDAFLGPTCTGPGGQHTYEVMVWLAQLGGLNPIGTPGTTTAQVGNSSFKLWSGKNTQTGAEVFSFVTSGTVNSFSGDLMDFFDYLVKNNGVDEGLLLTSLQAGTEVAVGSGAKFTTSKFTISGS